MMGDIYAFQVGKDLVKHKQEKTIKGGMLTTWQKEVNGPKKHLDSVKGNRCSLGVVCSWSSTKYTKSEIESKHLENFIATEFPSWHSANESD